VTIVGAVSDGEGVSSSGSSGDDEEEEKEFTRAGGWKRPVK
jgi:hypothetical protein